MKEKDEDEMDKAPNTLIKDIVPDKGKQIVVDDDLSHGLVDISTLSPL